MILPNKLMKFKIIIKESGSIRLLITISFTLAISFLLFSIYAIASGSITFEEYECICSEGRGYECRVCNDKVNIMR